MEDRALDRLYETLTDLHSGNVDAFRNNVISAFRQLVDILKEQQTRTRNQALSIVSVEREVIELKKRFNKLLEDVSEI
jgi:hypothetical protein